LAARRFFAAARIASSSSFLRASALEMVLPALSVVHSPSESVAASSSDAGVSIDSTARARSASAAARAAFFDAFEGFAAASSSFFEFLLAFLPASLPCFLGILAYCTYRGLEAVRWHQAIVTLLARAGE
jgi:hypothetical protein